MIIIQFIIITIKIIIMIIKATVRMIKRSYAHTGPLGLSLTHTPPPPSMRALPQRE
jgi:hypothetical protein